MHWDPANYKHQALTEAIIRAFYDVYNELGHGFLESIYEEAMFRVLKNNGVSVQRQYLSRSGFAASRSAILEPI